MSEDSEKTEATPPPPETRVMGLFQEVDEQKSEEIIYALKLYQMESDDEIEFYINSPGGCASDMFAIYDFMRHTKKTTSISTFGMGKVMSASVLLLAAGTTGRRRVGKNCRIMIHSVIAGNAGGLHDLKNEMKEIQKTQDLYVDALCEETKLTKKKIKDLISKNVNVYLSAEEAVEYGIADIIV
tara:strand:+ start:1198 stop:1749 length:552 start_codon:yes stop_codon:yes gene_type:complete